MAVLLGYLLLTALLTLLGSRIELRADLGDLLPEGTPSADDLRVYLDAFGSGNPAFVAVHDGSEEPGELLEEAVADLAARLEGTGLFREVRSGFRAEEAIAAARAAMSHLPVLVPESRAADLIAALEPGAIRTALRGLRDDLASPTFSGPREEIASVDPLRLLALIPRPGFLERAPVLPDPATGLLLAPDGRTALIVALPRRPPHDLPFSHRLVSGLESVRRDFAGKFPALEIDAAGGYLFAVQDETRIRHDIHWTAAISLGAIAALFGLFLRRITLLLVLLVPLCLSTVWTLGAAAIYPGRLNVVTVAFAAILLGMGDDSLTHVYLRYREAAAGGLDRAESLRTAYGSTGSAVLLATLTSGLAFASLGFVEFRGLAELGAIAAAGLAALLVTVFFLFPCLLSLGPERPARAALRVPTGWLVSFHRAARRRRALAITLATAAALAAAFAATRLRFSSDLRSLRGSDPARERLERVLAPFGGAPDPLHVVFEADDADTALHRSERMLPVCAELRERNLVAACASPVELLPSRATQQARRVRLAGVSWQEAAARFRRIASEEGFREDGFAAFLDHLERYGDPESVLLDPPRGDPASGGIPGLAGPVAAVAVYPAPGVDASRVLRAARAIDPAATPRAASLELVTSDLTALIEKDFRRASIIALGAVALAALAALRAPSRLLLVGTPVLFGCVLMLGLLALLEVPINLMNLVATPLVFGLGVDFGVYLVHRHEEEGRADVEKVIRRTGGAILLSGLTTMAGFGALLAADFAGLRSVGWVAVLGIGSCLLAALLLLPLLLPPPRAPHDSESRPGI